jgi:uncharacterized membrane protein
MFWAFFHIMDIRRALAGSQGRAVFAHVASALNAILYFAGMAALFDQAYPEWKAGVTLVIGAGYLFTLWSTRDRADEVTRDRFALTAVLLLVIATLQQYSNFALAVLWSVEAAILAALGLSRKQVHVWATACGILVLAFFAFLQTNAALKYEPISDFLLLFNLRAATLLTLVASCAAIGLFFKHWPEKQKTVIPTVMHGSWLVLMFMLMTVEILDFFRTTMSAGLSDAELERLRNLQQLSVSGVWLLYSIVLLSVGLWRRQPWLRIAAMVLFGVTIVKAFFFDLSFLETLYRIVSFIGLGVILVAVSYFYQRYKTVLFEVKSTES